jgi:hypothetical protein
MLVPLFTHNILRLAPVIALAFAAFQSYAADFVYNLEANNQISIVISGVIQNGDSKRFTSFLQDMQEHGHIYVIFLNSVGGAVMEAGKIADLIIDARIATAVGNQAKCMSACVILFMAGPYGHRYIGEGAVIGLHSASNQQDEEDIITLGTTAIMARYLKGRGMSEPLIARMISTTPENIYQLSIPELQASGVAIVSTSGTVAHARPNSSPSTPQAAPSEGSPSYQKGFQDRTSWEQWVAAQAGSFRSGIEFWASQRSLPNPASCNTSYPIFTAGCEAAKQKIAPYDVLRKSDLDYRAGWNAYPE